MTLACSSLARAEDAGWWQRDTLTGDWGGVRDRLAERGIAFSGTYIGEGLGTLSGGITRGSGYEGRLELDLDADFEKLVGWSGARFHASAFQLHGHGLSRSLGNLLIPSNIEARPTTRLFTLWLEQDLAGEAANVRVGQLAADDEFILSSNASLFLNSTFGWPAFASVNLPSGGVAFPLSGPGARLRVAPSENLTLLAGLFTGDPAGTGSAADPQLRDISGTAFSFRGGTFAIAEAQYALPVALPGTVKLGAWYHSGGFADQRLDLAGLSLAAPASSGVARRHRSDYAVYGVLDQTVWQSDGSALDLFLRIAALPDDRNLIGFYLDAGAVLSAPFAVRPQDKLGIGFAYARISPAARDLDRDVIALSGTGFRRNFEAALELTYQAQIAPWWSLQPDLQFLFNPGGTVASPLNPSRRIGDAVVVGLRSVVKL